MPIIDSMMSSNANIIDTTSAHDGGILRTDSKITIFLDKKSNVVLLSGGGSSMTIGMTDLSEVYLVLKEPKRITIFNVKTHVDAVRYDGDIVAIKCDDGVMNIWVPMTHDDETILHIMSKGGPQLVNTIRKIDLKAHIVEVMDK